MQTEKVFGLNNFRSRNILDYTISIVVGETLHHQFTLQQEAEVTTWIALLGNDFPVGEFVKVKFRLSGYHCKVASAHSLKEGKGKQVIV